MRPPPFHPEFPQSPARIARHINGAHARHVEKRTRTGCRIAMWRALAGIWRALFRPTGPDLGCFWPAVKCTARSNPDALKHADADRPPVVM
eukprot:gene15966-biopygen703